MGTGIGIVFVLIYIVWTIVWTVQAFLGYGTAYRKAEANGDNGVSLFGWIIVYSLAAIIPYLGTISGRRARNLISNNHEKAHENVLFS